MSAEAPRLGLLVPGLLGPVPAAGGSPGTLPEVRRLCALLGGARVGRLPVAGFEPSLAQLFGYPVDPDQDMPVGALGRLGEGLDARPAGGWMRADPVHLQADMSRLVLVDAPRLGLSAEEAAALAEDLNRTLLAAEGMRLWTPHPARWYLALDRDAEIRTASLADVTGRSIEPWLPVGPGAARWHRLMNEVQMVLHASAVNAARVARGVPAVNSLWFWGSGRGRESVPRIWDRVFAEGPVARGLAALSGTRAAAVPDSLAECLESSPATGHNLAVLEDASAPVLHGDHAGWVEAVEGLEQRWFRPLAAHLRARRARGTVVLYPADGSARALAVAPWWRRRPFAQFVNKE
ncbi:MAG TPA: hypothetical protein PLO69_10695 [Gammaproteobacteria bacterium]|nr:hypothetical protein [Gammaproteobacteria bacterium]